jgi:hypothetical protein
MSKTLVWSAARAVVLAGLAWVYSSPASVDAACYVSCTVQKDEHGACVTQVCNKSEKEKGLDGCELSTTECGCEFSGAECNNKGE